MRHWLIVLTCIFIVFLSFGQNVSDQTASIHIDLKGQTSTGSIPMIDWVFPMESYSSTDRDKITLKTNLSSQVPIKEIILTLSRGETIKPLATKHYTLEEGKLAYVFEQPLVMLDGVSILTLSVVNVDGVKVSSTRSIVKGDHSFENALDIDRKDYALIFATDKYDEWDDLVNPVNDAHAIGEMLTMKYGFEVDIIENATMEQVWEKIRDYNEIKFKPQDQLFIFFAGHGQFDESFGEGYVVASDSRRSDLSKSSYISHNRLRGVVDNIPSKHIFLAMDVCYGGTFDPRLARDRSLAEYELSNDQFLIRKLSKRTRKYLTSGGKEYVSDGIPGHHSPFATKFLKTLGELGGTDRILTIGELKVGMEGLKQIPRFGSFGTDEELSDFVFIAK